MKSLRVEAGRRGGQEGKIERIEEEQEKAMMEQKLQCPCECREVQSAEL